MDPRVAVAVLESGGISKGRKRDQLVTGLLQAMESAGRPVAEPVDKQIAVEAMGVLRTEEPEEETQWKCRVPSCDEEYHWLKD
jgi:hypothetical protein